MISMRPQPSLSRDFTVLSLFIVFLVAIVSVWVAYKTFEENTHRIQLVLKKESTHLDHTLYTYIEHSTYILESLGRQISNDKKPDATSVARLFQAFDKRDYKNNNIFSWIDPNQQLIASSNYGVLSNPIDVSDRDYVKKAITEPWKTQLGRPIKGRTSKKWVLPLSIGITQENGDMLGILVISIDIAELHHELALAVQSPSVKFWVTNQSLSLLYTTADRRESFKAIFNVYDIAKHGLKKPIAMNMPSGNRWGFSHIHRRVQSSEHFPLFYFLTYDKDASIQAVQEVLLARMFQLLMIALFLLFVLWTVRRRIIHPVITLTQQTASALQGDGLHLSQDKGPLEIQQLSDQIRKLWLLIEERKRVESELRNKNADLIRLKESARITNQIKMEFFNFVSEELRGPARTITEQAETMKDQHFGPLPNVKYLKNADEIYHYAQHMLNILQEIKAISEADVSALALQESMVDLGILLQRCLRQFNETNNRGIDVQLDPYAPLPNLQGDEQRLRQLLENIFNLAANNLSAGDVIRVSSHIRSGELCLIFAFAQHAKTGSLTNIRSTQGVTLALSRLLISLHQGVIETKTTPDRISTISLKFPPERVI